jgi:hypothetical protein
MNVEIGAEAAQFPEKEYINGIAFAVLIYQPFIYRILIFFLFFFFALLSLFDIPFSVRSSVSMSSRNILFRSFVH